MECLQLQEGKVRLNVFLKRLLNNSSFERRRNDPDGVSSPFQAEVRKPLCQKCSDVSDFRRLILQQNQSTSGVRNYVSQGAGHEKLAIWILQIKGVLWELQKGCP